MWKETFMLEDRDTVTLFSLVGDGLLLSQWMLNRVWIILNTFMNISTIPVISCSHYICISLLVWGMKGKIVVKVWREGCRARDRGVGTFSNVTVLGIFNQDVWTFSCCVCVPDVFNGTSKEFAAVFCRKQDWIFFMRPGVLKQNMNPSWPEPSDFLFFFLPQPNQTISTALSLHELWTFLPTVKLLHIVSTHPWFAEMYTGGYQVPQSGRLCRLQTQRH